MWSVCALEVSIELKDADGQEFLHVFLLYYMQPAATFGLVCALLWGIWNAARWAWTDALYRRGTAEDIARAIEWNPDNTAYLAAAALQQEYNGEDPGALLERIVHMNPTLAAPRIRLGLAAEQRGDVAGAEKWLLEAQAADRQYETRWTLANFYLRQDRAGEFWKWMHAALEYSHGDRTAAFDLCWRASGDVGEILERAIPPRPEVAGDFLRYVIGRNLPEAIAPAALRVHEPNLLLVATDKLIEARRFAEASTVWEQAGRGRPQGVTAPHFDGAMSGLGFDWRWQAREGVSYLRLDAGRGLRIRLSGTQPEDVELLRQYVGGLRAGGRYRLRWTAEGEVPAGLQWSLDGAPVTDRFQPRAEVGLLTLHYRRPQGSVRAAGTFEIREVRVLPLD